MLTSTNLCVIPFLGHCDNARLQMSAKQLAQSLTHINCEVPKLLGHDYHYLSDSSKRYRCIAEKKGEIIFCDDEIMIVSYWLSEDKTYIAIYPIPEVMQTSSLFATQLRYKRQLGYFNVGDILFEYDCFHNNIPTYGYNVWTAYMSFYGFNHEDSTVLSESLLNRMRSTKIEQILIPIYQNSIFYPEYPESSYRFLPMVGQQIHGTIVTRKPAMKSSSNLLNQFKNANLSDLTSVSVNLNLQNTIPVTCRIPDAIVLDLKLHKINGNLKIFDKDLNVYITRIREDIRPKITQTATTLLNMFPKQYASNILRSHYIMSNTTKNSLIDKNQVMYLIELTLGADMPSHLGDKTANRYANKGVCSLVIPDK